MDLDKPGKITRCEQSEQRRTEKKREKGKGKGKMR